MTNGFESDGLVKRFGSTTALAGVDMAAPVGTILGVLGPNGAGKTTAVRILATLVRPDAGHALVGGYDVVRDAGRVRELIGLTGQYASLDEELTGRENLVLIARLLGLRRRDARTQADRMLRRFDLLEAADRRLSTYSGGMRRRLDLAGSLVGEPRVLVLDEPTTGLDPGKREDLWRIIRSLASDGVTVLLTTQYLDEADALADDIVVLDEGRVIAHDTPAGLKQRAGTQTVVVRPVDSDQIPQAADLLRRVTGVAVEPPRGGALTVPVRGEQEFITIVRALEDTGIGVVELALRLPSLDEVFFTLTGRPRSADELEVAS